MKIIQIIDTLNIGGAEKMCIQLANLLFEKGHDVSILYFHKTNFSLLDQVNKDIPIHFIGIKENWFNPLYFYKVLRLIQQYDIIHVHMRSSLRIVYLATIFGNAYKKVVFHDHTGGTAQFESSSKRFLISNSIRKFKYVAVCNDLCKKAINRFNLNIRNTDVISNFVPQPSNPSIRAVEFDKNNLEFLVVGNFRKEKNQKFIIPLCLELKKQNFNNFRFNLLGSIQSNGYFDDFIEDIYRNNLKEHIRIYDNFKSVFDFNKKVNFAIMPSIEESGPLVLIEYLLLNLPFLAFNVGDITKKIGQYLPDQIMNNLNESLWVERIFNTNFENSERVFRNIYDFEFSCEIAYKNWMNVYEKLLFKQ
jgi:hypothetical protein